MPIRWDTRNKRWRYEFNRVIQGRRHRISRLLEKGWSQAQADKYDRTESARLYAIASGIEDADPLIEIAVIHYLNDKTALKSYKATREHLAAVTWAVQGKPMSQLAKVAKAITEHEAERGMSPATIKNRLACLKAACRWGWKKHDMTKHDPTARMQMPTVRNERHVYAGRRDMLQLCRAADRHDLRIAIRVAFYTGMRLGEILSVEPRDGVLVLLDTKNGDVRAIPAHQRIRHLLDYLPLPGPKITLQRAFQRARAKVGLPHVHLHDLRHSAASEMINAGVDLHTVGKVLGHRDARSTDRYAHLTADSLAAAVGTIGRR